MVLPSGDTFANQQFRIDVIIPDAFTGSTLRNCDEERIRHALYPYGGDR